MGQPATLRLQNRSSILSVLFKHVQLTRPQIAQLVGVSTVTANSIVRDLLGQGLVEVFEPSPGPLGRPAQLVTFSARAGTIIGLDVQRHQLHVVTGKLTAGDVAEEFIHLADGDDLTGRVLSVLEQHREIGRWGLLKSVMLSLPAPVGPGGVPGEPNALPDFDFPRVAAWVKASRVLMAYGNDANLAAAAERHQGYAQGEDSFALLLERDSGLGCGLFLGGSLYLGQAGRAGEFDMTVWHDQDLQRAQPPRALEELGVPARSQRLAEVLAALVTILDLGTLLLSAQHPETLSTEIAGLLPAHVRVAQSHFGQRGPATGAYGMAAARARNALLAQGRDIPEAM